MWETIANGFKSGVNGVSNLLGLGNVFSMPSSVANSAATNAATNIAGQAATMNPYTNISGVAAPLTSDFSTYGTQQLLQNNPQLMSSVTNAQNASNIVNPTNSADFNRQWNQNLLAEQQANINLTNAKVQAMQNMQPSAFDKVFNYGSTAFDMYNKYRQDQMNRKIQKQQLSDMQYDRSRKEHENNRLDANRKATTDSYQNGRVF